MVWSTRLLLPIATLLFSVHATAAPVGYAVNSDAFDNADKLLEIDLADGSAQTVGALGLAFEDVEGLALSLDGTLYGVDDATNTLITISQVSGLARAVDGANANLAVPSGNGDYGLTFTCDGSLYMSSDNGHGFFSVDPDSGNTQLIGTLDKSISGISAWGQELYGIGADGDEGIYRIDPTDATTELLFSVNFQYEDAGLAFDDEGTLWAILDGTFSHIAPAPRWEQSKILRISLSQQSASLVAQTSGGVESLAITSPGGCSPLGREPVEVPVLSLSGFWVAIILFSAIGVLMQRRRASRRSR